MSLRRALLQNGAVARIALFGGSFNPPHVGHVMVASWILATDRADEVWLMPAAHHAFAKPLAPFEARVAMLRAGFAALGKFVSVSEIENERAGPSFTIDTVEILRARFPAHRFSLVVGTDVLVDSPKWKEWDRLLTLVELLPVRRAGCPGSEPDPAPANPTPLFPDVSSTLVRERLARGETVEGLVPAGALAEIRARSLYR